MKCLCGYEYEENLNEEKPKSIETYYKVFEVIKGNEPFIFLGSVTGATKKVTKYFEKYACPKCGTVKIIL